MSTSPRSEMKLRLVALDGFGLYDVSLRPNNGMDVEAWTDDRLLYRLRVESRGGHVRVIWDGHVYFDNGKPLYPKEETR